MIQEFDFQIKARDEVIAEIEKRIEEKNRTGVLLCAPTASGKTFIASMVLEMLLSGNKNKILVVVNLQSLVSQVYLTLREVFGIDARVVHNDLTHDKNGKKFKTGFGGRVIITMPETYCNIIEGNNANTIKIPKNFKPSVIWFDEAHKATSENNQLIRDHYPDAIVFGTTATPYRPTNKDGEHIVAWYGTTMINTISVKELIKLGRLVQPYYFSYNEDAHIVNSWKELCANKELENPKTVVFTLNSQQSLKVKEAFDNDGIAAEIITSGSEVFGVKSQTQKERDEIYQKYREGKITVLITVNALCEGWDEPCTEVCILARTVGNIALYQQMVGRALRAFDGKECAYVMDFFENYTKYGSIEDINWEIDDDTTITKKATSGTVLSKSTMESCKRIFHTCTKCNHVYDIKNSRTCNQCGQSSGIKVEDKLVSKIAEDTNIQIKDKTHLKNIISSIIGASNAKGVDGDILKIKLNDRFGAEIFIENDTGDLVISDHFNYIKDAYKNLNKISVTTKVFV